MKLFFAKVGISPIFREDTSSFAPDASFVPEQANPRDLDRIVFQYLLMHGHEEAAEHLARDAAIRMPRNRHNMRVRSQVREALLHGDVDRAIRIINDVDPEVRALTGERTSLFMHHAELCDADFKPNHHLSTDRPSHAWNILTVDSGHVASSFL